MNRALSLCGLPNINTAPGEIALDSHIHTMFSHCSISMPERILRSAVKRGLGAIAIMDHNSIRGATDTLLCADYLKSIGELPSDFVVIPGVEINSSIGHVGALFVDEIFPMGLCPEKLVDLIHDAGGLAVACHPYHSTGIGDAIFDAPFDVVEVECGSVFGKDLVRQNRMLISDPRLSNVTKIGSSDAHYVSAIGCCYTVFKNVGEPTLGSARYALENGNTRAEVSDACTRMRKLLGLIPKLK